MVTEACSVRSPAWHSRKRAQVKRSPLRRGKPLSRGTKGLKRTPFKRPTLPPDAEGSPHQWSTIPRENARRKAKRRASDFGPHGDWIIPALPCAVEHTEWWSTVSDETLSAMMDAALWDRGRYEMVSEPAHAKSRGAGGRRWDLVPLAPLLHSEQHSIGIDTFQAKYGVDLNSLARRLWRLSPARALEETEP